MKFSPLAKAVAFIACILSTTAVARDSSFELPPVYSSMSEAKTDPAFTDGIIIQTDGRYDLAESTASILNDRDINAAVVNGGLENGMVRFWLDGQTSDAVFFSEEDFVQNSSRILITITHWNAAKRQKEGN